MTLLVRNELYINLLLVLIAPWK